MARFGRYLQGFFGASMLLLPIAAIAAAPLGIAMGTPIKSLKVRAKLGPTLLSVDPPISNPNFQEFEVKATPLHGVCAVVARTEPFPDGEDAASKFFSVIKLLAIYGRPHTVKFGKNSALQHMTVDRFPREWNRALPNNISSIVVEMVDYGKGPAVELVYFYRNMTQCSTWEPKQNRTGL